MTLIETNLRNITIKSVDGNVFRGVIAVNGLDISKITRSIKLDWDSNNLPIVTIEIIGIIDLDLNNALIRLTDEGIITDEG